VVHKEIILPENAPPEFTDRENLWNSVEASKTRKNSQLAREIIVALPRELDLEEQIEVMREYVRENFVNKGMIADFAIHDKGDDNPHAHIMLTTRHVTRDVAIPRSILSTVHLNANGRTSVSTTAHTKSMA